MPPKKKKTSRTEEDELMAEWTKARQMLKPKDQVELAPDELKEIIPRILQAKNPQVDTSLVLYDFHLGSFVPLPQSQNIVVVYSQRGTYLHVESDEAQRQLTGVAFEEPEEVKAVAAPAAEEAGGEEEEVKEETEEAAVEEEQEEGEGEGGGDGAAEGGGEGEAEEQPKKGKKLPNQFNFCDRAALTYKNPCRTRDAQTTPAAKLTYSANVLQWNIYDSYLEDFALQEAERERERELREKDKITTSKKVVKKKGGRTQLSEAVQGRVFECWKTLERMINQNTYDEMGKDFRYWDDPADEFRDDEGTLLPLWRFNYERTKKNTVTDTCWNPYYYDLYAVTFAYMDFTKPIKGGAVCLFTIKNPSFPDYICMTEAGVMCVDIHKPSPYMIVIGLNDGNVMVYNVQANCTKPAFVSNSVTQKHAGVVWEVKWAPDMADGEMNFYSVASDGKVNNWILMQNEFVVTTIIDLYLEKPAVRGPDGTLVKKIACATCIRLHPKNPNIYLVGTEEGLIYKCSVAYSSAYLMTYDAHQMPVHRIDYNKLNSDLFASCSADWRIKVWEDNRLEPLFVFDVGASVGDVKWAPYSSTILGAVTSKGKAYIFDLNVNKYKPICEQAVVSRKRYKLTRISFNHKLPVIICGDDKGTCTLLKLSPNLRIPCKPPKKQQHLDNLTLELMKLDRLLALVREPNNLNLPPDPAESGDS